MARAKALSRSSSRGFMTLSQGRFSSLAQIFVRFDFRVCALPYVICRHNLFCFTRVSPITCESEDRRPLMTNCERRSRSLAFKDFCKITEVDWTSSLAQAGQHFQPANVSDWRSREHFYSVHRS